MYYFSRDTKAKKMLTSIGFGKKLWLAAEAPTPQGATEMIFENNNW
jgi:hypothetical protein